MSKKEEWFKSWFDTRYYHILYQNRDYLEAERFIFQLLRFLQFKKGTKCLDLACGMGRHAVLLSKEGLNVTGLDLSANSIQNAKIFEAENLHFDVHDMRLPYKNEQYDAIFNLFTSFGYFENREDNLKTLSSIHQMLVKDGQLIIDFINLTYVLTHLVVNEHKHLSGIDFYLQRYYEDNKIIKNITFEDKGEHFSFTEKVQAITKKEMEQMLKSVGFEIEHIFGNYLLQEFDENTSDRLIIIARKK